MSNLKVTVKRYLRAITSVLRYFFVERPIGVDFSLRQKNWGIKHENNNGYAMTPEKSFDNVMKHIENPYLYKFIDIGCGKGGVLFFARKYNFKEIAGLEIEDCLFEIAQRNFRNLHIDVKLYHDDATTFEYYDDYDCFFLFNPFPKQIYELVLKRILDSVTKKNKKMLYNCVWRKLLPAVGQKRPNRIGY